MFGVEGRYATALYSAATKQKQLDAVEKELVQFKVCSLMYHSHPTNQVPCILVLFKIFVATRILMGEVVLFILEFLFGCNFLVIKRL